MRDFKFLSPKRICFGAGCAAEAADDIKALGLEKVFLVTAPPLLSSAQSLADKFISNGLEVLIYAGVDREPTFEIVEDGTRIAREFSPDAVVALGGGAVMDAAKWMATLHNNPCDTQAMLAGDVPKRTTYMVTMPTTAGAGSEVSHGCVLYDTKTKVKTGVAHHYLMPDACYIDPLFAVSAPASVTAGSGFDALAHCIEGYANKIAHPDADVYSIEGIKLISANLARAVKNGDDVDARGNMGLGSMYAGKSLVMVNTNAVHALAYPITGRYLVPHGVANAMFLAEVMAFNLPAAPRRYADIAIALGVDPVGSVEEIAQKGVDMVRELARECGIPDGLSALGIPEEEIPSMAEEAVGITRLMKNNLREMSAAQAEDIYRMVY